MKDKKAEKTRIEIERKKMAVTEDRVNDKQIIGLRKSALEQIVSNDKR